MRPHSRSRRLCFPTLFDSRRSILVISLAIPVELSAGVLSFASAALRIDQAWAIPLGESGWSTYTARWCNMKSGYIAPAPLSTYQVMIEPSMAMMDLNATP